MSRRNVTIPQAGAIAIKRLGQTVQVLLVRARQDPSHWIFPKGHVERGERPEDTALRELQEEAGATGDIISYAGTLSFPSADGTVAVDYFLIAVTDEREPGEGRERCWSSKQEALALLAFEDARRLLSRQWKRIENSCPPYPA